MTPPTPSGAELHRAVRPRATPADGWVDALGYGEDLRQLIAKAAHAFRASVVVTDADLDEPGPRILYVNPAFEDMTGYRAAEVLGRNPRFLQGPDTDRSVLDRLRRDLEETGAFEGEAINYRADGSPFIMSWRITAIRDDAGTTTHYVAVQEDVSALRVAQQAERDAVLMLQAGLLPTVPDELLGWELAVSYTPAGDARTQLQDDVIAAGGDWYDALALDDGRLALVIGDVTGHGLAAAAVMGRCRWALDAVLAASGDPLVALGALRALAQREAAAATVAIAVADPATGALRCTSAGHVPMLIVRRDGTWEQLVGTGAFVGVAGAPPDQYQTAALGPGDSLVAYTDGLVERRGRALSEGIEELGQCLAGLAGESPATMVAAVVERFVGAGSTDDVALLVARRPASP